jgi:hypothetical protein
MHTLNTYVCPWFRFVFCLLFVFVLFLLFVFFIRIGLCYLILRIRFVTHILMKYISFVNTRIAKYIMLQTVALSSTSFNLCLFFICESLIRFILFVLLFCNNVNDHCFIYFIFILIIIWETTYIATYTLLTKL